MGVPGVYTCRKEWNRVSFIGFMCVKGAVIVGLAKLVGVAPAHQYSSAPTQKKKSTPLHNTGCREL